MIIIGGRHISVKINKVIDSFDKVIRCNLALPNGYNGTRTDMLYINNHLYVNFYELRKSIKELKIIYPEVSDTYLKNLRDMIGQVKVKEMMETGNIKSNKILKTLEIDSIDHPLRCGHQAILEFLSKRCSDIFIYGFSVDDKINKSFYNQKKNPTDYHKPSEEFNIIRKLHNTGKIDATLCTLVDDNGPCLDCSSILPTRKCIEILQKYKGNISLINFKGDKKLFSGLNVQFKVSDE